MGEIIEIRRPGSIWISEKQWKRATLLALDEKTVLEAAQIRSATGMRYGSAKQFLLFLGEAGHASLLHVVRHCSGNVIAKNPYFGGLAQSPKVCPDCELDVSDSDDLRHELQATLRRPLRLI